MQTLFHENPYRQRIANGHSCMVRVHTRPEYQMMTPDTDGNEFHLVFMAGAVVDVGIAVDALLVAAAGAAAGVAFFLFFFLLVAA